MAITLNLSQIIELSGGTPRRMKQLANDGVFIPIDEERLSRAPRRYTISEAAIACLVAKLAKFNISSPALHGIAEHLRDIYQAPADYGFMTVEDGQKFWAREVLLASFERNPKPEDENARLKAAMAFGLEEIPVGKPKGTSVDELHRIRHWYGLENARAGKKSEMAIAIDEDEGWRLWTDSTPKESDKIDAYIVINVHRVLSVLK